MRAATVMVGLALAGAATPALAGSLPHYSKGVITCADGRHVPYKAALPSWYAQPPMQSMTSACSLAQMRDSLNRPVGVMHPIGGGTMTREELNRNAAKLIGTPPPR